MALWELGALELARAIASGETTSVEALDVLRGRAAAVNDDLNAIVGWFDGAEQAAVDADQAVSDGAPLGPLHGVPFSVKANIDVAGSATTSGAAALAGTLARDDAPIVERLRAGGAFPFARTNMPDFGVRNHTYSSLHGRTRNPWNDGVTAGGSSGGEASALAAGMTPLGLGNDIAGSVRNPAHCCGVAAVKPSTGLIAHASSIPPGEVTIMYQLMLVQGVLARRVADLRAALLAAAGPHRRDPLALPVTLAEPAPDRPLRIAVAVDPPGCAVDREVVAAIRAAADALAGAGHEVVEAVPASYGQIAGLWWALCTADFRALRPSINPEMGEEARAFLDFVERMVPGLDANGLVFAHLERNGAEQEWHAFLTDWDVLLTPASPHPPAPHDADIASVSGAKGGVDVLAPLLPANLFGLPAAVVPCGFAAEMPVGAQFTARRFGDLAALAAAQALEDICGVLTPIEPRTTT